MFNVLINFIFLDCEWPTKFKIDTVQHFKAVQRCSLGKQKALNPRNKPRS